jgi:DNA-directed RNA polymerase specialized sigma24 family protein
MSGTAKKLDSYGHPVLQDVALRERLLDLMWARIQKTVAPNHRPRPRRRSNADLVVAGGIIVQDVLNDALAGVLHTKPEEVRKSWEALATTIAHNKAVQAVRDNTKGRLRDGDEIDLVPLHQPDENGTTLADKLADELADPEAEAIVLQQELALKRLAEQHLSNRDREIYFRIHYLGQKRSAICHEFGITAQAVGQIYVKAARKLHEKAQLDPEFLRVSDRDRGGN